MEKLRFKDENGDKYPNTVGKIFKDILSVQRGASPRPIEDIKWFNKKSSVGWVRISDISKSKKYLYNTLQNLSEEGIKKSRFVKKDSLILSICATIGIPIIIKKDCCIHDGLVVFQELNNIDKEYLYYFLENNITSMKKNARGTTQLNLNTEIILKTKINLPILIEQAKIANYFSNLDSLINNKQRQLELMEKYKEDLLDKIFNQKVRFKDENGCDYPEWKTAKVKEIFNITRGNVISKILLDLTNNKNNFPVYSSQTKKEGIMGYYDKFLFQDSIIWTTDGANAGTTRYVDGKFYCSNVCGVLLRNTETPNTLFAELINTKTKRHITASVIPKFMNHAMAGLEITYPTSIEEQFKISKYISNLNLLINNLKLNIKNMQKLKLDMLEKMF